MYKNYNSLITGRDTCLKNRIGVDVGSLSSSSGVTLSRWLMSLVMMVCLLTSSGLFAQVSAYTFAQSSGTYTPIAVPTTVGTTTWDDTNVTVALPFSFVFNGTSYASVNINPNGFLNFGATTTNSYVPISATVTWGGVISAMGVDLVNNSVAMTRGLEGVAPNRVFIVQWNNGRRWNNSLGAPNTGDVLNFQIRLYETTNVAEVVYGTNTATSMTVTTQVGLRGATNAAFLNRTSATDWSATSAGGVNTATITSSPTVQPVSGLTFTWTPPPPCVGTPTPGTIPTTATTCSGASTGAALTVTGYTPGVSGLTFQWEESDDNGVGDAWANAVGGTGATTTTYTTPALVAPRYYRVKVTCSGSDAWSNSSLVSVVNCAFDVTRSTGITYTSIVSTGTSMTWNTAASTPAVDPTWLTDENTSVATPFPFPFTYRGNTVSQFRVSTNGFLTLSNAALVTQSGFTQAIGSTANWKSVVAPFWEDLVTQGNPNSVAVLNGASAPIKYQVDGVSPNRVLTVEWSGMEVFLNAGPNLNFQAKFYETSNNVEFVYGSMEGFNGTLNTLFSYASGLNGENIAVANATNLTSQQLANTRSFAATANNALALVPDCNSSILFTPGTYTPYVPGPAAPANDEPATAISVTVNASPCTSLCGTYFTTLGATASAGITVCGAVTPGTPDDDVWFSFVATTADANIRVYGGGGYNPVVQLFSDLGVTSLNCVNATGNGLTETINATGLINGNTYYVRVYHQAAGNGTAPQLSICVSEVILPPTNDNIGTATSLTVNAGCVTTSSQLPNTLAATASPTTPAACNTADDDVWYSFVATSAFNLVTVQSASGYNASVQMLSSSDNTPTGTLTQVACVNATSTAGVETISATLVPGNTYFVRVYHAVSGAGSGNFTICVSAPVPDCATIVFPADTATGVQKNPTLTWTAGALAGTSYDVYLDTVTPPVTLVTNTATTSYVSAALADNTLYYVQIVAKNANGDAVGCAITSFTTGTEFQYCLPDILNGCTDGDVIARVTLNTLDNNSGTGCPGGITGYSDYTSNPLLTTTLQAGAVYNLTVFAGQYTEAYAAWIDYNDDGTFENPAERIGFSPATVTGSGVPGQLGSSATFPINVACNPATGLHRLRVRAMYDVGGIEATSGSQVTPCDDNQFGEVEDYIIEITSAADCPQPFGLAADNVTATTADLSWSVGCAESAWEIVVQAVDSGVPAGAGTSVTGTPTYPATFGAGAQEFYVRADCVGDGYSEWSGPFVFTAPDCSTVVSPTDDEVEVVLTAGNVQLTWTAVSGATSYDVNFGTTSGALTLLGSIGTPTVQITGLQPSTEYFWRIDPKNLQGVAVGCTEWSFTTEVMYCTPAPTSVDGTGITNVTFGTINNTTGAEVDNYGDYSALITNVAESSTVPVNITFETGFAYATRIWVDWNDDFDFDDVGEEVYAGTSTNAIPTTLAASFNVPAALYGQHRLRIGGVDGIPTPCYASAFGSFEDYSINVTVPPVCTIPSGLTITALSDTTASVSWTGAASAVVEWGAVACVAGVDATAGACGNVLPAGSSPQIITGLTLDSSYSVYVRQDCGVDGFSENISASYDHAAGESCVLAQELTVYASLGVAVETLLEAGASADGPGGSCSNATGNLNSNDRWVKFVAPLSGNRIVISTSEGTIDDAVMQVWTDCPVAGSVIGCSDDENAFMPELSFCQTQYTPGATYYVQIWPYGGGAGDFNIQIYEETACPAPPANDECAGVETLLIGLAGSCPGSAVSGTTVDATASAGIAKTDCDPFATYNDVFYMFNSGSNTEVNIAFESLTGIVNFGLYTGCGTGYTGVCDTTFDDTILGLDANTDYYIVVWSNPGDEGTFTLCLSATPPCTIATTWNGTSWNNGTPTPTLQAIIAGNYTSVGDLSACSLTVNNNAVVVVNSNHDFSITGNVDVQTGSLTFANNANLLQDPAATVNGNTGNVVVTRNASMRRQDYVYWSSPVANQNLLAFSPLTLANRFYQINEVTNSFVPVNPATNSFVAPNGYAIRAPNTFPPNGDLAAFAGQFTGVANNGNYSVAITNSGAGKGYNLVGNPYPSPIDADLFLAENPGTLYFWTHFSQAATSGNNYATYNGVGAAAAAGGETPNGFIQTGQGFLLNTVANGTADFNNGMRVGNNQGQFYRTANVERHRIWMNLSSDATPLLNQALIGYMTGATQDVDQSLDGPLNYSGSSISSVINDGNYVIQGRSLPFADTDEVPMNFKAETDGSYTLAIDHVDGLFAEGQDIFLRDNLTGIVHNIKESAYTFASVAGTFANRFVVVYQSSPLGIETPGLDANSVIVFKKETSLHINSGAATMATVRIFDIRGRMIFEQDGINASTMVVNNLRAEQQVLIVQITSDDNKTVSKKVVY